jgi:hypothetical protein
MTTQDLPPHLRGLLQQTWENFRIDSHLHLSPQSRLHLYDALTGQHEGTFFELCCDIHMDSRMKDFHAYHVLGFITANKVLPIWKHEMERFMSQFQDWDPCYRLPITILKSAEMALTGSSEGEINEMITKEDECADSVATLPIILGNLREEFCHPHYMALRTTYDVHLASYDISPLSLHYIHSKFTPDTTDEELDKINTNYDFSYHACESFISKDPNPLGWGQSLGLPIERDSEKALEFWHWWLFEAIPQAWNSTARL